MPRDLTGSALGPTYRPWKPRVYKTIREYAIALILRVDRFDQDGRNVGFDYEYIRDKILAMFPFVTYSGPHKGKQTKMTYKELHEITCSLNRDRIRLPLRPRRKVHKDQ